jgi:hypothetical protein
MYLAIRFATLGWLAVVTACGSARPDEPALRPGSCTGNVVPHEAGNLLVRGRWQERNVVVLVDTGATGGSISPAMAQLNGRSPVGMTRFAGAAGQFRDAPVYPVDGLSLGGVDLGAFRAHESSSAGTHDFSIGLAQLETWVATLDLGRESFCLGHDVPDDVPLAPMRLVVDASGRPTDIVVAARVAGVDFDRLELDTGAGVSTINEDLLPQVPHERLPDAVVSVDATGVEKREYFVRIADVCVLGNCEAEHVFMPGEDLSPLVGHTLHGIVGLPFFARHRLVLDFERRRIGLAAGT